MMQKTIVTIEGKDTIGIIAKVCTFFADSGINILEINQTTSDDNLYMMMVVDTERYSGTFRDLTDGLSAVGKEIGCSVRAQHEEIFDMMHRI